MISKPRTRKLGRQWEGTLLRVPVGGVGHWAVNETAAARFTELTGIETEWENNPYDQVYDKTFLDLGSQSGTYDILDLNFAWFGQFIATDGLLRLEEYVNNPAFRRSTWMPLSRRCWRSMPNGKAAYMAYRGWVTP